MDAEDASHYPGATFDLVQWEGWITEAPSVGNGVRSYSILGDNLEETKEICRLVRGCSNVQAIAER